MKRLLKTLGNAALVVGGFFIVFFTVSKTVSHNGQPVSGSNFGGIANADSAPSCSGSCAGSCDGSCDGGSCDGGGSDGASCDGGGSGDCGDSGDCGK